MKPPIRTSPLDTPISATLVAMVGMVVMTTAQAGSLSRSAYFPSLFSDGIEDELLLFQIKHRPHRDQLAEHRAFEQL